eukprot:418634-Prymnesium_polylepis.2
MRLALASHTSHSGARHPCLHAAHLELDDRTATCAIALDFHTMPMIPFDIRILWMIATCSVPVGDEWFGDADML